MFCEFSFPDDESNDQRNTDEQTDKYVGRRPRILVATPLHAHHEQQHSGNTERATNEIDLLDDFSPRKTLAIDAWRWEVEDDGHD